MYISFIIPVYNVEHYLNRCLDSILACELTDSEVILVIGGSSDASNAICEQYCAKHPNFNMLTQKETGLSDARNCGFKVARGEYTIFVDSDDYIDPVMFKKALSALYENPNAEAFIFDFKRVNQNGQVVLQSRQIDETAEPIVQYEYLNEFLRHSGGFWNVWRYIYNTEFLRKNNLCFRKDFLSEDVEYTIDVLLCVKAVCFFHAPYYCYLTGRGDSLMDVVTLKRMGDTVSILTENIKKVQVEVGFLYSAIVAKKLALELVLTMANVYSVNDADRIAAAELYRSKIAYIRQPGFWLGQTVYYATRALGVCPVAYLLYLLRGVNRILKKARGLFER